MLSPSNELANFREGRDVFENPSGSPRVPGLVCMPIVPPTSGREQQIGQDAAENERNSNQELQNRIHHGFLQGISEMLKPDNVGSHTLDTLTCDAHDTAPLDHKH